MTKKSLSAFSRLLKENNLDSYLVINDTNIRYLTGFQSSESWLVVNPTNSIYLTDSRYYDEAKKGLKLAIVEQFTHSLPNKLFEILQNNHVKTLGFDDRHISLNTYHKLLEACPKSIKLKPMNHLLESIREIKSKAEISVMRECLRLQGEAYHYLMRIIKPGRREDEVFLSLEQYVKKRGAIFSFPPIIASGPNSAFPHALITQRVIKNNEPVLVDMGIELKGYKSDLTRMYFLGKINALYAKIYAAVKEAQNRAIAMVRSGVLCCDVDQAARKYLESLGLAKFFGHSTGHGVGLDIHESPRLSSQNKSVLKEGMVITIEPGVYLPGRFGIRLEEMVLVKKHGCEVLSRSS